MAAPENPGDPDASAKPTALSCLTPPSFSEAREFINSKYSCLAVTTHRRHIALSPKYMSKKRSGITEHLNAELLKYNVVLEGVPVAYDNIKLIGELGDIYDDVGYIHINIEADFVVFQPQYGEKLVGVVNKKAPSHIGCLVHGCFNASIPRPMKMLVEAWQHVDVNVGDQLEFEVFRLDSDAVGVLCIRGRLSRTMEAAAIKKMYAIAEEQNANVSLDKVQNGSEIVEEGAVDETTMSSEVTSKSKRKKRSHKETFSETECPENQQDANTSLEEAPKKKKKKHKHQEIFSQDLFLEVDGNVEESIMETSLQSSTKKKKKHRDLQNIDNDVAVEISVVGCDSVSAVTSPEERKAKKSKKKKHSDLQNLDNDVAVDISVVGCDTVSAVTSPQERKAKKSKKKKETAVADLESGLHNGTGDSVVTEDTLEGLVTEPATTKKRKKKHKNTSIIME